MIKKICALIMMFFLYTPIIYADEIPEINSQGAILIEAETGQILFEKNADKKFYPASITKVLTALIALEENNLTDEIIVGDDVPNQIERGSSSIYLLPGEKLTLEELMYGLMVESANDAAVAIAEHTSGSEAKFAEIMNKKAKELGATNSNFVTSSGLHDDNHYTTAKDMALIMRKAITYPELRKFMTTSNYTIEKTNKQDTRYLWTKNRLYKSENSEYYYEDVIASKTGYTSKAGNTLISAAERDGMKLIVVILGGSGPSTYTDTINLFEYGFENFTTSTLINENDFVEERKVEDASNPLKIVSRSTIKYVTKKDNKGEVKSDLKIDENLRGSISKGEKIGTIRYTLDNTFIGEAELVAGNDVISNKTVMINKLKSNIKYIIPAIIVLYIILRFLVHIKNVQIRKRRISRKYGLIYKPYKPSKLKFKPYKKKRKISSRNQYYRY